MLKLKKLEYIEDKDSIKLLIKLFNLINITIFLKNTITNNKNYKSNFYKWINKWENNYIEKKLKELDEHPERNKTSSGINLDIIIKRLWQKTM